jgi:hypothetical protein
MFVKTHVSKLTSKEKSLLAAVINYEGTGEHPWADKDSLEQFAKSYTIKCLDKAIKSASTLELRRHVVQIKEKVLLGK